MKEEFYNKVAEQVMSTYRDGVQVPCGTMYSDGTINYIEGFYILGKGVGYNRITNERYDGLVLMSVIVPPMVKKYAISDRDGKRIFYIVDEEIKKRVKMRLLYNKGRDELQKC